MSVSVRGRRRRPDPESVRRLRTLSRIVKPRRTRLHLAAAPARFGLRRPDSSSSSRPPHVHRPAFCESASAYFRGFSATVPEYYVMYPNIFIGQMTNISWRGISREPLHERAVAMSTAYSFRGIPQILSRSAVRPQSVERKAEVSSTRGRFLPNTDRNVGSCESRNPVSEFYGLWAVEQLETRKHER